PEHIDAAHKNGVKATATIFFPWGDSEFVEEAMEQFTEKDSEGNYIIAEKLFEIAEYYGFEGFFINQESDISESLANDLKAMLKYIQNNKPRSEEHTSELQSRFDLVCRLLLEKKNI